MQPNTATRPEAFDAAVISYLPALRSLAKRYIPAGKREDVIQDVLAYIFANWRGYRHADYGEGSGFYSWMRWCFRGVISNYKNKKTLYTVCGDRADKVLRTATEMATQERALIARDLLDRIGHDRAGVVLLRRASGEKLKEVASDMNISTERVRQLEETARAAFMKVAA